MANGIAEQQAARKQVTVLYCDVVDYTIRSNSMDPEDLADEIRAFQSICSRISEKYHGTISNFLGDGVLVVFGHPYASEFDPEHAVKASLEIIEGIEQNNSSYEWRSRHPISVRVGIATSLVVIGEKAGKKRDQDEQIHGQAPNLAARLQELARPNTVVTSLRTRRLVGASFKFRDLGDHSVKGFKQPISAWCLISQGSLINRTYSSFKRVTTRFVSRHKELSFLNDHYEIAVSGRARFVHLVGEAGVGKSRLVRVFEKTLKSQNIHRVRINCSPYYQTTTLKPVLDEVCRWIQVNPEDEPRKINTQIRKALTEMEMLTEESVALFFEALSIPLPNDIGLLKTIPEDKHHRTIRFLASLVYQLSTTKPVILILEDLHWADPTTGELLNYLMTNGGRRRIFAMSNSRPEYLSNVVQTNSSVTLHLKGLDRDSSAALVHSLFENTPIPLEVEEALVQKSDGMPLFLEECSWQILNQVQSQPNLDPTNQSLSIPDTLQDSLNARLDQLGTGRELAQLAATFGSPFSFSEIKAIADLNGIDADSGMDIMMQAGLLRMIPNQMEDQYAFNHALIQEAAYESLLRKSRQLYHQQLVQLFIHNDPDVIDTQPELIAYHYSRTNNLDAAVALWLKATKLAIHQSAIAEAMDHIDRGLTLLTDLPKSNRVLKYELEYLLNLAVCHTVMSGYFGEQVEKTYHKCIDIADLVGNREQQWSALYGFWRCLICRGEFGKSLEISVRLKRLSNSLNNRALRMTSLGIQAMTRLFAGKFQSAEAFFESSIESYDHIEDKNIGIQFGQDPYVTIQGLYAVNKLICDNLAQSKLEIEKSVNVARNIGHPYTVAETLRLAAMYEQIRRDMKSMRKFASEAIALSDEYGFHGLLAASKIFMAFCDVVTYRSSDAVEIIKFELTQYKENYGLLFFPYFQGLLAEAYLYMNRYQEAFTESAHVLLLIEKYGETWPKVPALLTRAEAAARGVLARKNQIRQWYLEAETLALTQKSKLFVERVEESRKKIEKTYATLSNNSEPANKLNLDSFSEDTYKIN